MAPVTGCSATPRLNPRPKYPPLSDILLDLVERQLTIPVCTCVLYFFVGWPIHVYAVRAYKAAGYTDEATFLSVGFAILKITTFLLIHGFFFVVEYFQLFEEYRINRKPSQIPSMKLVIRSLTQVFVGTFIAQPLIHWTIKEYILAIGMPAYDAPLYGLDMEKPFTYPPATVWHVYKQMVVCHICNEVVQYVTHRVMHHQLLYAFFHKKHHTWVGIVSHGSEYAHVVENIFNNFLPAVTGPFLLRIHPSLFGCFAFHKLKRSYEHHGGYAFHGTILERLMLVDPKGTAIHDYHHTTNQGNFGAFYLDWMFGTMDHYLANGGFEGYVLNNPAKTGFNPSYLHRDAMKEHLQKSQ